jgi:hypothetical protein
MKYRYNVFVSKIKIKLANKKDARKPVMHIPKINKNDTRNNAHVLILRYKSFTIKIFKIEPNVIKNEFIRLILNNEDENFVLMMFIDKPTKKVDVNIIAEKIMILIT